MKLAAATSLLVGLSCLVGCGWFDDGSSSEVSADAVAAQVGANLRRNLEPGYRFVDVNCVKDRERRFACREVVVVEQIEQSVGPLDRRTRLCLRRLLRGAMRALEDSKNLHCPTGVRSEIPQESERPSARLQFFYLVTVGSEGEIQHRRSVGYFPEPILPESRRTLPPAAQELAK